MKSSLSPFGEPRQPSGVPTLAPEHPDLFKRGQLVGATYEIQDVLGSGGLGQVYDAIDQSLGRRVAIKVSWQNDGRLRREARAIAPFRQSSLPILYGIGEHEEGDFVVLERVYGITLASQLQHSPGGALSLEDAARALENVVSAVAVLHRAGLVHLDIRPANIMASPGGRIVLLDFGLCVPELNLTTQLREITSPSYIAPELVRGGVNPDAARLADIYDLGVLGFELLTGQVPMKFESLAAVDRSSTIPRPSVRQHRPDAPEGLIELIDAMLSTDPQSRPKGVDVVRSRLLASLRPRPGRPLNVMIVEDSKYTARTLERYTKETLGTVNIKIAHDGQKAIDTLRDFEPDVMLLDLHMPDMSGIELCMYLRGAGLATQCKIVSVTSSTNAKDEELLHVLGIDEFLVKDDSLEDNIAQLLRHSEMRLAS